MAEATDPHLLQIVESIERLIEERKGICDDIRDRYALAKAVGYDVAMVRWLIAQRAMKPEDRAELDMLREAYAAAVGLGDNPGALLIEDLRPDAGAIALNMLTAEIVMMEDPAKAATLVEHVLFLLDLRAEIALLRSQEADRRKLAKIEGFDTVQLQQVVRWLEKCAKHGEHAMRAGEATFRLYRGTVAAGTSLKDGETVSDDGRLQRLFAPAKALPKPETAKQRQVSDAAAAAQASRMFRGN